MLRHRVLFQEALIAARVRDLALEIKQDLPSSHLVIVGLLTGSFVFVADLARAAAQLDLEPRIDFLAISHYGGTIVSSGNVKMVKDVVVDVRNQAVLLVDDILDSGWTLQAVRDQLAAREPAWLRTCVLLDKPSRRTVNFTADYVGFEVPDYWIIGYGLDAAGEGRALPYVGVLEQELP
jgi:hypoxanthine phosphoribosyltransferase